MDALGMQPDDDPLIGAMVSSMGMRAGAAAGTAVGTDDGIPIAFEATSIDRRGRPGRKRFGILMHAVLAEIALDAGRRDIAAEAVWKIDVIDFPAFIVVDDKGNDFFAGIDRPTAAKKLDVVS